MTTSTTVPNTPPPGPMTPTRSESVSLPTRWWRALGAEWTKLTSIRSTYVCLALSVVIGAAISALMALAISVDQNAAQTQAQGALTATAIGTVGIALGQFALLAFAALTMTGEYATGTMRPTLSGVPGRGVLIAAKAAVVAGVLYVAAFVMSAVSALAAAPLLGDDADLDASGLVEFSARSALSVTLLGLFVVGLGAVLRSTAGTITATLGLVFAPMIIGGIVSNSAVGAVIDHLPNSLMEAVNGADGRYGAVQSGLLLGGWALLALIVGYVVLRRRDA